MIGAHVTDDRDRRMVILVILLFIIRIIDIIRHNNYSNGVDQEPETPKIRGAYTLDLGVLLEVPGENPLSCAESRQTPHRTIDLLIMKETAHHCFTVSPFFLKNSKKRIFKKSFGSSWLQKEAIFLKIELEKYQ